MTIRTRAPRALLAPAALILAALAACSTEDDGTVNGMEQEAYFACEDFIGGYESAQTRQARLDLADTVNEWAPDSGIAPIRDTAVTLARVADGTGNEEDWQLAADSFAQACLDAGWNEAN
ncbi:hypothetical protein [Streptomyces sp. NPDC049881]|uniref:hypothetical protein n=1 Tax=Streptomyces sp. NPDC049881 TaxID=3155778 RepID=UPI00341AE183